MREILFRGKRKDNGEWIIGDSLIHSMYKKGDVCIGVVEGLEIYSVIPETVGQYTGLTDKNGNPIWEGDIVREAYGDDYQGFVKLIVEMDDDRGGWFPFAHGDGCGCCQDETWDRRMCEVIGNIHDNPELVRGEEE